METDYMYDAFISYRHASKDTMIASEVQKSLERFRIPGALRKSTGINRFNRVFRDVEELPLASNLTEELEQALKGSRFLIVICSYRTSESDWVKREIETFLKFHENNKQLVLTVLVEGEPDEVIPEELKHDNITHYLADGTFYCKDEAVEPLSADYRLPVRKARKTELPRLAAALLGCKYDEIIRRRKAYQRRRLLVETAIISAIAVGIMVYIGQLYLKMQENLYNAQVSQSIYYASESRRLLEGGDRIGAIQLALAALENSDGSKRPHTDEAELALTQALGSYSTIGVNDVVPLWRYETESPLKRFWCSYSGEYIAALDTKGAIHIWNTTDHNETVYRGKGSSVSMDFRFDKDDNLIVCTGGDISVIDTKTLKEKWQLSASSRFGNDVRQFAYFEEKDYIVLNCVGALLVINATNGQKIKAFNIESRINDVNGNNTYKVCDYVFTPDFSRAAVIGYVDQKYNLISYDVKSDKIYRFIENTGDFLKVVFDESGNILVLRHLFSDKWNSTSRDMYDAPVLFEKYSTSGEKIWSTELSSVNRIFATDISSSEYVLRDGTKKKVSIAVFGNRVVIVDDGNGQTLKTFDLSDNIIGIARPQIYSLSVALRNGCIVTVSLDANDRSVNSSRRFKDDSIGIISFNGKTHEDFRYFIEDSSEKVITEYTISFSDRSYMGIEGTEPSDTYEYYANNGDYLLALRKVISQGKVKNTYLMGVDLKERKVLWEIDTQNYNYASSQAFSPDNKYVYLFQEKTENDVGNYSLIKIDVKTGEVKKTFESIRTQEAIYGCICCQGGKIWVKLLNEDYHLITLGSYDLSDDSYKEIRVDTTKIGGYYLDRQMIITPDGESLIFHGTRSDEKWSNFRLIIDLKTGEYTTYDCDKAGITALSDNGKYIAERSSECIKVFSDGGKEKYKIDTDRRTAMVMGFHNDLLYVLYDTDDLCCYDLNGRKIMELNLGHDNSRSESSFEFAQGLLFVTTSDCTDVIDLGSNKLLSTFKGLICLHNTGKDRSGLELVVKCFGLDQGCNLGCFKFKTTDLLIQQAKEYLAENGVKMSDEFKLKYGIE